MKFVAFFAGMGAIMVLIMLSSCFFLGPDNVFFGGLYLLGWSMGGHGYPLGPIKINFLVVYAIAAAFFLWHLFRVVFQKAKIEVNPLASLGLLLVLLFCTVAAWYIVGGLLMTFSVHEGFNPLLVDPILDAYEKVSSILEPVFGILIPLVLAGVFIKYYGRYHRVPS